MRACIGKKQEMSFISLASNPLVRLKTNLTKGLF
jgi:hypothetical protein